MSSYIYIHTDIYREKTFVPLVFIVCPLLTAAT